MKQNKRSTWGSKLIIWIIFVEVIAVVVGLIFILVSDSDHDIRKTNKLMEMTENIPYEEVDPNALRLPDNCVPRPEVDEQLLTINEYSRPGKKTKALRYIVVHYLGNPNTTAQQNHDYFESLKDLKDVSMSANYIIGMEGEIIQCVPDGEVAYASNKRNDDSISVENCHKDNTGILTVDTYESLVKLVAYLSDEYDIDRDHIIRHYDVTGKECPKYYVRHPKKWEEFKDDVFAYRKECQASEEKKLEERKAKYAEEAEELANYLESNIEFETMGDQETAAAKVAEGE